MKKLPVIRTETDLYNDESVVILRFECNSRLNIYVKNIAGSAWSKTLSAWYLPTKDRIIDSIYKTISEFAAIEIGEESGTIRIYKPDDMLPVGYLELLQQKRYSFNTIKTYASYLLNFQRHFKLRNSEEVSKEEINAYLLELIKKKSRRWGTSS